MSETKTVNIPKKLYEQAESSMSEAGFDTVDGYVAYIVEQVLSSMQNKPDVDEKVKNRLRKLGYMD